MRRFLVLLLLIIGLMDAFARPLGFGDVRWLPRNAAVWHVLQWYGQREGGLGVGAYESLGAEERARRHRRIWEMLQIIGASDPLIEWNLHSMSARASMVLGEYERALQEFAAAEALADQILIVFEDRLADDLRLAFEARLILHGSEIAIAELSAAEAMMASNRGRIVEWQATLGFDAYEGEPYVAERFPEWHSEAYWSSGGDYAVRWLYVHTLLKHRYPDQALALVSAERIYGSGQIRSTLAAAAAMADGAQVAQSDLEQMGMFLAPLAQWQADNGWWSFTASELDWGPPVPPVTMGLYARLGDCEAFDRLAAPTLDWLNSEELADVTDWETLHSVCENASFHGIASAEHFCSRRDAMWDQARAGFVDSPGVHSPLPRLRPQRRESLTCS